MNDENDEVQVKVTIKFRKPRTKVKFKDSELQFGRQIDELQMVDVGSKCEASRGRKQDGLRLNPGQAHTYRTTGRREQRQAFPL